MINIYVGNLPYKTGESDIADLFSRFGMVERATIVKDRETGRSRGFGFVEMADHAEGLVAIETLLKEEFNGRPLTINEARPRGGAAGGSAPASPRASTGHRPPRTSFGNSIGYSNQLTEEETKPRADTPAPGPEPAESTGEPSASRGYTNELLGD